MLTNLEICWRSQPCWTWWRNTNHRYTATLFWMIQTAPMTPYFRKSQMVDLQLICCYSDLLALGNPLLQEPLPRVVLTTNHLSNFPQPIQDRCQAIEINPPTPLQFLPRAIQIADMENCKASANDILATISSGENTIRSYMRGLEAHILAMRR